MFKSKELEIKVHTNEFFLLFSIKKKKNNKNPRVQTSKPRKRNQNKAGWRKGCNKNGGGKDVQLYGAELRNI